jgi:hypothetical protein
MVAAISVTPRPRNALHQYFITASNAKIAVSSVPVHISLLAYQAAHVAGTTPTPFDPPTDPARHV